MLLANREDEAKRFDQFVLMLHANPMTDEKARERYIRIIEPQQLIEEMIGEMVTDLDQLRRIKEEQTKGV